MKTPTMVGIAGILFGLSLVTNDASATTALQITLQVDSGTPVTITDSNDLVNDLNAADGTIDFTTTVDGVTADGRAQQVNGPIHRSLLLGSRMMSCVGGTNDGAPCTTASECPAGSCTVGGEAVFHNTDVATHTVKVTIDSDTFPAPGPALGWVAFYNGTADDASGGTVEIEPLNDVEAFIDRCIGGSNADASCAVASECPGGSCDFVPLLSGCVGGSNAGASCAAGSECPGGSCGYIQFPIAPTAAVDQPVIIPDVFQRGVDPTGDAVRSRLVWTFDAGPDDEIRLPDSENFDALGMSVYNAQNLCVFKMNKAATNVEVAAQKSDEVCIKEATGDVTACVDAQDDPKTASREATLVDKFALLCTAVPPPFGANLGTCCQGGMNDGATCSTAGECASGMCIAGACIAGAAEAAVNALTHDLFGGTVNVSAAAQKCQVAVDKVAGTAHKQRWKVFTECKRNNVSSFTAQDDLVATCLSNPQPDPNGKIASAEAKLAAKVQRKCIDKGFVPLSAVFPGVCASQSDAAYAACIAQRVACRFCLGAKGADDIGSPLDCDEFDDGVTNSSCP